MRIRKTYKKILLISLVLCIALIVWFVSRYKNRGKNCESKVTPIFYYENLKGGKNGSTTIKVDACNRATKQEPFIRTFSKAIPKSVLLEYGIDDEDVMKKYGFLLTYFSNDECKVAVFDESFSTGNKNTFRIHWNRSTTTIDYQRNEYYIKTVPIDGNIHLYTYEENEDRKSEDTINVYIMDPKGSLDKRSIRISDYGVGIGNINRNGLMFKNSNWYFPVFLNGKSFLYILNQEDKNLQLEWDGTIVSVATDMSHLYVLSTTGEQTKITILTMEGNLVDAMTQEHKNENFFINERSVYLNDGILYYFIAYEDGILMNSCNIHTKEVISKEYKFKSKGILRDIILQDAVKGYDLIPGIGRSDRND